MTRETFLLINMLGPLVAGMIIVRVGSRLERIFDRAMLWNLLILSPILSLLAFWKKGVAVSDLSLPLIGVLMLVVPGAITWGTIQHRQIQDRLKGSLLISSLFASRTTVGILSVYVFCGEAGYGLARLVMMFGPAFFYVIGFPIANYYANAAEGRIDWRKILVDPKMLPVVGLGIGILLNLYGPERPAVATKMFPWLIAVNSWLFIIPVGMSMRIRGLGDYWGKAAWFVPLRFVAVPLSMLLLCLLFQLKSPAWQVVMLLSVSPVATGAVIMARLYRIDEKMVMAAYLITTTFYVLVMVPVLVLLNGILCK